MWQREVTHLWQELNNWLARGAIGYLDARVAECSLSETKIEELRRMVLTGTECERVLRRIMDQLPASIPYGDPKEAVVVPLMFRFDKRQFDSMRLNKLRSALAIYFDVSPHTVWILRNEPAVWIDLAAQRELLLERLRRLIRTCIEQQFLGRWHVELFARQPDSRISDCRESVVSKK